MDLELITSYRGCEIHRHLHNGTFYVYEIGESPETAAPYAIVSTRKEADLVVDSLAEFYVSLERARSLNKVFDSLFDN